MLYGTDEELAYHSARATEELELSDQCQDPLASLVHMELARMHQSRKEFVSALRNICQDKPNWRKFGCTKES